MSLLSDEQILNINGDEDGAIIAAPDAELIEFANAIEAAVLEELAKQEPVAWCVAYDDPRMGRIHSNPTMCEPQVDAHVSKCGGVVVKVPLYAAPVVQPGMEACPDKGPWSAGKTDDGRVYIESEDFEHDVRLYVDGDFAPGEAKHYAERMAAWMNAAPVVQPAPEVKRDSTT